MTNEQEHIRHIILYYFRKGKNAKTISDKICKLYGNDAVNIRTCFRWIKKFRVGDFDLKDKKRSGRGCVFDDEQLKVIIEQDLRLTTREISVIMNSSKNSVSRALHRIGKVNKLDMWVPHELTPEQREIRMSACVSLKSRQIREPFLSTLITGDEKWILYSNKKRQKSWVNPGKSSQTIAKPCLTNKKVMLCVWWDSQGVIYYELLKYGETITADKYCQQLDKLKQEIQRKRPQLARRGDILLQHDNARPHKAIVTQKKISDLGWEVLSHPSYSPDLAPSDFHLFRSLQNALDKKKFQTHEEIDSFLISFFESKPKIFYKNGIQKLIERWSIVIQNEGNYVLNL